jgi:hypothetical protein
LRYNQNLSRDFNSSKIFLAGKKKGELQMPDEREFMEEKQTETTP